MLAMEWDESRQLILVTGFSQDEDAVSDVGVKIGQLVNNRLIHGLRSVTNESTESERLLAIEIKRTANPQAVINELRKHLAAEN